MPISIQDIIKDENIANAMNFLMTKKDSCGIDGMKLSELPDYWNANGRKIIDSILDETYTMGSVKQSEIVNYKGKRRTISLMNSSDRLIYRAVFQLMNSSLDIELSPYSYAYRENKGVLEAVKQAASYMENGNVWCVEVDIHDYFDNINHQILLEKLHRYISDEKVMHLLDVYLKCTVVDDHIIFQKEEGILQGGPLSPLLGNFYLNELDRYMEEKQYHFCRFGDDINIYCSTYEEAIGCLDDTRSHIENQEMLPLNHKKTGIFKGTNRKYLGYRFIVKGTKIIAKHNILFENEEGKKYIPVETTDSLYIYSNVIVSGSFLEFANRKGLSVCFIDKYGEKVGAFVPQNNKRNIKTELKQLRVYDSEKDRLCLARKLEIASLSNIRANLKYYQRRKESLKFQSSIEKISDYIRKMNEAVSVSELMLIEAQARQMYYQCFNFIIENTDFRLGRFI